jgi:hypothetical protein
MTERKEDLADRNLVLIKKRLLHALQQPSELEILAGVEVIELPRDDPELLEANLQMATNIVRRMFTDGDRVPILLMPAIEDEVLA